MHRRPVVRRASLAFAAVTLALASPAFAASIVPLADRVLVERADEDTPKGIIIPDSAKQRPAAGVVVQLGTGRQEGGMRVPFDVQPGDRVIFGRYSGTELTFEGREYLILREDDILAVIED